MLKNDASVALGFTRRARRLCGVDMDIDSFVQCWDAVESVCSPDAHPSDALEWSQAVLEPLGWSTEDVKFGGTAHSKYESRRNGLAAYKQLLRLSGCEPGVDFESVSARAQAGIAWGLLVSDPIVAGSILAQTQ